MSDGCNRSDPRGQARMPVPPLLVAFARLRADSICMLGPERSRTIGLLVLLATALALCLSQEDAAIVLLLQRALAFLFAALPGLLLVGACTALGFTVFPLRTWRGV